MGVDRQGRIFCFKRAAGCAFLTGLEAGFAPVVRNLVAVLAEYVFDLALAADMFTTLDIKNQRNADGTWRLEEKNGLLGTHPSDARVISYIALAATLHAAITYEMVSNNVPMSFVHAWEYVSIGVATGFAVHNYTIGLRFAL